MVSLCLGLFVQESVTNDPIHSWSSFSPSLARSSRQRSSTPNNRLQAPRLGGDRRVSLHGCWSEGWSPLPWPVSLCSRGEPRQSVWTCL